MQKLHSRHLEIGRIPHCPFKQAYISEVFHNGEVGAREGGIRLDSKSRSVLVRTGLNVLGEAVVYTTTPPP